MTTTTCKPLTIGLRGLAGAGKTTIARLLAHALEPAQLVSLADPIRLAMEKIGVLKDQHRVLYRDLAQTVGARCRAYDSLHWVQQAIRTKDKVLARHWHVIFDDIRYPNEAILCDRVFYIHPVGFLPEDLGPRADHESETWNREVHRDIIHSPVSDNPSLPDWFNERTSTQVIFNRKGQPIDAARTILSLLPLTSPGVPSCPPTTTETSPSPPSPPNPPVPLTS